MNSAEVVRSNGELEQWLQANTWFEDASCEGISFGQTGKAEFTCRIELGLQVAGSLRAGEERVIRGYVLTATGLGAIPADAGEVLEPGHCCDGIEIIPSNRGVAFRIDLPGRLDLACEALVIETKAERRESTPPWTSEREFGAEIPGEELPSPASWVERFKQEGVTVTWRYLGSDAQEPSDPTALEGWFLQEPGQIASTKGGLFFFGCRVRGGALAVQWQRGEVSDGLWGAAKRALGRFERARVWCGNCQFSALEWLLFAQTGALPRRVIGSSEGPGMPPDGR